MLLYWWQIRRVLQWSKGIPFHPEALESEDIIEFGKSILHHEEDGYLFFFSGWCFSPNYEELNIDFCSSHVCVLWHLRFRQFKVTLILPIVWWPCILFNLHHSCVLYFYCSHFIFRSALYVKYGTVPMKLGTFCTFCCRWLILVEDLFHSKEVAKH